MAERMDLEAIRERLARGQGPEYWRGLEERCRFDTVLAFGRDCTRERAEERD